MDLNDFDFKDSGARKCELVNPIDETPLKDDDGNSIYIEVYGADSDKFRSAQRQFGNKKLKQGKAKTTMEEIEGTANKILAKCTVGWSGIVSNGELVEFSEKSAEWLYGEYSWIKEQVDSFVNERANFLSAA